MQHVQYFNAMREKIADGGAKSVSKPAPRILFYEPILGPDTNTKQKIIHSMFCQYLSLVPLADLFAHYNLLCSEPCVSSFTKKEISDFSANIGVYSDAVGYQFKSGLFLMALINNSRDSSFSLNFGEFGQNVSNIGFKSSKLVYVSGNLRDAGTFQDNEGCLAVSGDVSQIITTTIGGSVSIHGMVKHIADGASSSTSIVPRNQVYVGNRLVVKDSKILINE